MEKFLAIVVLIIFVILAIPHVKRAEWIAPSPIEPGSWVTTYNTDIPDSAMSLQLANASDVPSEGYGWFRVDFWNHPSPTSRPATRSDLDLHL